MNSQNIKKQGFSAHEINVRKHWLWSYIIQVILFVLDLAIRIGQSKGFVPHSQDIATQQLLASIPTALIIFIWIALLAIFAALFYFPTYYFAYEKRGTKWLLAIIAINIISFVRSISQIAKSLYLWISSLDIAHYTNFFTTSLSAFYKIGLLLAWVYFIIMSLQLYQVNASLKHDRCRSCSKKF